MKRLNCANYYYIPPYNSLLYLLFTHASTIFQRLLRGRKPSLEYERNLTDHPLRTHHREQTKTRKRQALIPGPLTPHSDQFSSHITMLAVEVAETKQGRSGLLEHVPGDKPCSWFAWPEKEHSCQSGQGRARANNLVALKAWRRCFGFLDLKLGHWFIFLKSGGASHSKWL